MNATQRELVRNLKEHGIRENIPNISFLGGEILQFLAQITAAKTFFEIGCANGFSTLFLADMAQQSGGKVVTCDISVPSFTAAQKNIRQSGLSSSVDFRFGDACTVLRKNEVFDYIFIDGQKNRTHEFFALAADHLAPRGIIVIDDTTRFPEKMKAFFSVRKNNTQFSFWDIAVEQDDTMTVAFLQESS